MIIDYATVLGRSPYATPVLAPTIGPLGRDRLIPVRYVHSGAITVCGSVTGRTYHFTGGESCEIPLVDARALVLDGDFAFSGGR